MKRLFAVILLVSITNVLWGDRLYLGKAGNKYGVTTSTQDMFVGRMIDTFTVWDVTGQPGCAYGIYTYLVIKKQVPFLIPVARVILRLTYQLGKFRILFRFNFEGGLQWLSPLAIPG